MVIVGKVPHGGLLRSPCGTFPSLPSTPLLPVPFLFPRVSVVVVAALLPEARAVMFHELKAVEPFCALVEVELGYQQAYRATMVGFQVLTVVLERDHHIVIIEICKGYICCVACP